MKIPDEDLVVVYINPHSGLPIWLFGNTHITIEETARLYVPEGVEYTIIPKINMAQPALSATIEETIQPESAPLFYDYLGKL
jgi:hypothetical protein